MNFWSKADQIACSAPFDSAKLLFLALAAAYMQDSSIAPKRDNPVDRDRVNWGGALILDDEVAVV